MILSDREIKAAIKRGAIRLSPTPDESMWSSTAVDLRLAPQINQWKRPTLGGVDIPIRPADEKYSFPALQRECCPETTITDQGYVLAAGKFILGWTIEKIRLPHHSKIAARVEGKSSLARLGLGVHVTAPTIHAGFGDRTIPKDYPGNPIQLEIWNVGPLDIVLVSGMKICQLIFESVEGTPDIGYTGQFADQGTGTSSAS
ncbi:dCTP deaminase [Fimbriiglobus ruber]|uniref:Deoxycytidine triphosphate deaminase n=1 Tax=Fimbriiglobus ruber TaxID=1908690 RepID=A0A225E844_9BACT|nr:dCTP deaminase [Fimbriiglobus ruber]OWK45679.1 Deoxycytidine triphosphate deaminase [Fimbriiglobus ruber]